MTANKEQIIEQLNLLPHPLEGGYFRRTYESDQSTNTPNGERSLLTSIFYCLTDDHPIGYLHKNKSDILHYFHLGDPITYYLISPQGEVEKVVMGADLSQDQVLQLFVPGGFWKASHLEMGEFGLISEAVSPGFDYSDNQLATRADFAALADDTVATLSRFIKR